MNQPPAETAPPEHEMDLFEHVAELRYRLIVCFISVFILAVIAYFFSKQLFTLLSAPFDKAFSDSIMIGTGPAEAFILRLKVSFFTGIIFSCPVIFYQIWSFVSPGLYEHERKLFIPFMVTTTALFAVGVWFCFALVLPLAFDFFREQYLAINVTPRIKISEHLSIVMRALFGFGLVFEMPVLAFFLGRLGIISHHTLIHGARYAIVIIFILSAVLTPPDVVTQFLMAGPLLILYGISILIVRATGRAAEAEEQPPEME